MVDRRDRDWWEEDECTIVHDEPVRKKSYQPPDDILDDGDPPRGGSGVPDGESG